MEINNSLDIINDDTSFHLAGVSIGKNMKRGLEILNSFSTIECFYSVDEVDDEVKSKYNHVSFFSSDDGFEKFLDCVSYDFLINALVGFVGLHPTLLALSNNKTVALANKESLVVGGELINKLIYSNKGSIIPIDSEHVAVDKCLFVDSSNVKRIILTASGGAFRKLKRKDLAYVKSKDALKHPTWNMGNKITIDSATMMNKCFEIIEAYYLFGNVCDRIDILLHDESKIHSLVQYKNGLYRAEISKPDMHNPIRYAMHERNEIITLATAHRIDDLGPFTNHRFSLRRYPLVRYAKMVIENKGIYGCVLNASNEVCVNAFLKDEISFLDIEKVIDIIMSDIVNIENIDYEVLKRVDYETRLKTEDLIRKLRK